MGTAARGKSRSLVRRRAHAGRHDLDTARWMIGEIDEVTAEACGQSLRAGPTIRLRRENGSRGVSYELMEAV
jgi:hypothetical protein